MVETQLCKLRGTSDTFVGRAYCKVNFLIKMLKTTAVSTTDGWLKLNFASCVVRKTRSLGALVRSMTCCVTFVVFTDCESCTRSISTNPGSMEAGEYGLTRGTCFVARRCRGGRSCRAAVDFVVCFWVRRDFVFFFFPFLFPNAHGLPQV